MDLPEDSAGRTSRRDSIDAKIMDNDTPMPPLAETSLLANGGVPLAADAGDDPIARAEARVARDPADACARLTLAQALLAAGSDGGAEEQLRIAIGLRPGFGAAHLGLAQLLLHLGLADAALDHARRASENMVDGRTLKRTVLAAQALCGRATAAEAPARAAMYLRVGETLARAGRLSQAVAPLSTAAHLRPAWANPLFALGNAFFEWGDFERAVDFYRRVVALVPDEPAARCKLAMVLRRLGEVEAALEQCRLGLALAVDDAALHWTKSHILLSLGRFEEGWHAFEWRWRIAGMQPWPSRLWDGRPLDGRAILVRSEQGLGDTIQFLRYLPLVAERGGRVLLHCQPPLKALVDDFPGVARVLGETDAGDYCVQVPMMSLARLFGTTLATIPAPVAELALPSRAEAAQRVRAAEGLRVGLVWAGNPEHKGDFLRSCPLALFASVLTVRGARFFALQKDIDAEELAEAATIAPVEALGANLADTAAAIAELDVVITVDTAIAHLAATLGRPTWVLLATFADWRWLLDRDDSPWYPSMRLFRQRVRGDWAEVMGRVAAALQEMQAARAGADRY